MTSSKKTLGKPLVKTWITFSIGTVMLFLLVVLYLQVRNLEEEYGSLKNDLEFFENSKDSTKSERDKLRSEVKILEEEIEKKIKF